MGRRSGFPTRSSRPWSPRSRWCGLPPRAPASHRALKRPGVFPRPERNRGALAAEFQALEQVAHALPEPVEAKSAALDLVDELPAEHGRPVANLDPQVAGRVLVELHARREYLQEGGGGPPPRPRPPPPGPEG